MDKSWAFRLQKDADKARHRTLDEVCRSYVAWVLDSVTNWDLEAAAKILEISPYLEFAEMLKRWHMLPKTSQPAQEPTIAVAGERNDTAASLPHVPVHEAAIELKMRFPGESSEQLAERLRTLQRGNRPERQEPVVPPESVPVPNPALPADLRLTRDDIYYETAPPAGRTMVAELRDLYLENPERRRQTVAEARSLGIPASIIQEWAAEAQRQR